MRGTSGRSTTVQDEAAAYSRESAKFRDKYQDPKDPVFRRRVKPAGQPDFVTFFPKRDTQTFHAQASREDRQRGMSRGGSRRGASRGRGGRRRSKQLESSDLNRPPSASGGRTPRGGAVNAPRTPRGSEVRESHGQAIRPPSPATSGRFPFGDDALGSTGGRHTRRAPPMPKGVRAQTALYGKGIDFRNPRAVYHLVQKERRAATAARQKRMIDQFTKRFLAASDSPPDSRAPSAPGKGTRAAVSQAAQSALQLSPVTGYGNVPDAGGYEEHFPMPPDSRAGPEGSPSPGLDGDSTFMAGGRGMAATMPALPTADDLRVMTAFTGSLAGTLKFGQSKLERVDIPPPRHARLTGSRSGLAALSTTSLYAPDPGKFNSFVNRQMEAVPDHARYGKIKVGVTYCFPVSLCNLGLTPKRFRVTNTVIREDSVEAVLHCRYPAVRLAPGCSETIEVFVQSTEAGRLWGSVEIVSPFESFTLPVSAHVLSEPAFEAEREATTGGREVKPDFSRDVDPEMWEAEVAAIKNAIPRGGTNARVQVVVADGGGGPTGPSRSEVEKDEEMAQAALKVQKSFRGHLGRKKAGRVRRSKR